VALMALDSQETVDTGYHADASLFQRVTFSYRAHLDPNSGTLDYRVQTSEDLTARKLTTTYSGRAVAATEAAADALIDAVLAVPSGGKLLRNERTANNRKGSDGGEHFMAKEFAVSYVSPLAAGSDDVIEASWSLECVGSQSSTVITPIPFSAPHVQTGCGTIPGSATISGVIVALSAATAKAWARSLSLPGGGYMDPLREKLTTMLLERTTATVTAYKLEFTYSARYTALAMP